VREDITYHHCHAPTEDLTRRVTAFEERVNQNPFAVADRLWVKNRLDPEEEKLRVQAELDPRRSTTSDGNAHRHGQAPTRTTALKLDGV